MKRFRIRRLTLALFALLLVPGGAIAEEFPAPKPVPEPRCRYLEKGPSGERGNVLLIDHSMNIFVRREGQEIVVLNLNTWLTKVSCKGGVPTVFSIDRIVYRPLRGAHALHLEQSQGEMVPGASPEPGGDEIEIEVDFPKTKPQRLSSVIVTGTEESDRMRAGMLRGGRIGINLAVTRDGRHKDEDLFVRQVSPFYLELVGGRGGDVLNSSGIGLGSTDAVASISLRGDEDSDRLLGGPRGESIDGGDAGDVIIGRGGRDRVSGDKGGDLIYGGPGNDEIASGYETTEPAVDFLFGGEGRDSLRAVDGNRDRLYCGPGGPDHAYVDLFDEWGGSCEKQHGPGAPR